MGFESLSMDPIAPAIAWDGLTGGNASSPWGPSGGQRGPIAAAGRTILAIDERVPNYDALLAGLDPAVEVVILDGDRDGIDQLTGLLRDRANVSALHVLSHGAANTLYLGSAVVTSATLGDYRDRIEQWRDAFTPDGDIVLYGCEVGQNPDGDGHGLVDWLSDWTGADVAASDDATGGSLVGANWDLEVQLGAIESQVLFGAEVRDRYDHSLGVLRVTSTADNTTEDNFLTLREAVLLSETGAIGTRAPNAAETANISGPFGPGITDTINLSNLTGQIDLPIELPTFTDASGVSLVGPESGGLTLQFTDNLNAAIVNGNAGGNLSIRNLTIRNSSYIYNAIENYSNGRLTLDRVSVENPSGYAVFAFNDGPVSILNSTISNSESGFKFNSNPPLEIINSTFSGIANDAINVGGVGATILHSTIVNSNRGIVSADGGIVNLRNTIVAGNVVDVSGNTFVTGGGNLIQNPGALLAVFPLPTSPGPNANGDYVGVVNPLLGPLAANGGPTRTHEPQPGSLAIDGGNGASVAVSTDQRGLARISGSGIDIGAVEVQMPIAPPLPIVPAPIINLDVFADGVAVADGSPTPVDFGDTVVGVPRRVMLQLTNAGDTAIALGSVTVPAGFQIVGPGLPSSLAPGTSAGLMVELTAIAPGDFGGVVLINNDTPDESPYNFTLRGRVGDSLVIDLAVEAALPLPPAIALEAVPLAIALNRAAAVGGQGSDALTGDDRGNLLYGLGGDDRLDGNGGNDILSGQGGRDWLSGGDGDDRLNGGADDDVLFGDGGNDLLFGGLGNDYADGGDGDDLILGNDGNDTLSGGAGNDTVLGDLGDDLIFGSTGANVLWGGSGADTIIGGDGDDAIDGGDGADRLNGGSGADLILGGAGDDVILGGAGNDTLDGGAGNDSLQGGEGSDLFILRRGDGNLFLADFDPGEDRILLIGFTPEDFITEIDGEGRLILRDRGTGEAIATLQRRSTLDPSQSALWFI
jgi:hypothetical protein